MVAREGFFIFARVGLVRSFSGAAAPSSFCYSCVMDIWNTIPSALHVALIAFVGGLAGWVGHGFSFVLKRWWTGSPKHDQANYLSTVADLGVKLRANGMTMEDVRQLEAIMRDPSISSSTTAQRVVEDFAEDASEPDAFHSNVAMKARTGAAYEVAEAKLQQVLMDLQLLLSERENGALEIAQQHWREYRRALEDCALLEYGGGTHAPLAMVFAGLNETERRADELRAQVGQRSAH
ncbi:MAG: lysozyme inhibitor LprI family protein [Pseudomonadota bacterium]